MMISIKKYLFLFAVTFMASNSAVVCADVSEETTGSAHKRKCNQQTVNNESISSKSCSQKVSTDVSWSAWLTGDSRSNQFHYLDLLELLFRDDQNTPSPPNVYE